MIRRRLLSISLIIFAGSLTAGEPAHPGLSHDDWSCAIATSKAIQVSLTNDGLIDQNKVDNDKTEITLLAKEALPRGESRQVFLLTLHEAGGRKVTVVTQSKTGGYPGAPKSDYECPYDDPKGYVVSRVL